VKSLHIKDVTMTFNVPGGEDVHALEHVSLDLKPGELVSVLGPSGCGKSTLLNIVAGFLSPTAGEVTLEDERITGPSSDRAVVVNGPSAERGMVFQQGALFEWMTVEKNIAFGPKMAGKPKKEIEETVKRLLSVVGLDDFAKKSVYELSGGMQQRVALARCLANDPEVILMDEPLGALDALTREKMQGLVLKLWKETGKTIILITHSVEEALLLGERLIVMAPRPGRIEKEFHLPFAELGLEKTPREVKGMPEFVENRDKILTMIWEMEEDIMGYKEPAA
jgi:taurine transport system ATP-binding protein